MAEILLSAKKQTSRQAQPRPGFSTCPDTLRGRTRKIFTESGMGTIGAVAGRTREQILLEIKTTAQLNGGKPLGQKRFVRETGIRSSEWLGRYWIKWSDAVAEAGLNPNAFNSAFDSEWVLECFAEETRRLGHFPSTAEIKFRRRDVPNFPGETAVRSRGGRAAFIRELAEFCERRGQFDDVLKLILPELSEELPNVQPENDTTQHGYVYLIKAGRHYKIGRTNSLSRRGNEIGLQLPEPAERVHAIRTDDAAGIEHYWHRRFADKRRNGEWFELSQSDVRAFQSRKSM